MFGLGTWAIVALTVNIVLVGVVVLKPSLTDGRGGKTLVFLSFFTTCAAGESVKEAGKRIDKTESEMGNCGSNQPKKRGNCHESAQNQDQS